MILKSKDFKLIYLILILTLNFSCVSEKSSDTKTTESVNISKLDTLKFTSGIRAIFHDSKSNYWFGSHSEGVCRFNGESFEYFTTIDGLSDNQIRSIQEDKNGTIWFGTSNGVSSYNGKRIINHTPSINIDAQNKWTKSENDLWFNAGNNTGIYRFDGKKIDYLAFPIPLIVNSNNSYLVTGIAKGKNNMLWISTYAGVFGYDGSNFTLINDQTLGLKKENAQLHVRSVLEDSKGRLWIGNNGIGVLLQADGTTINFSEEHKLIHPESKGGGDKSPEGTLEHVFVITEDNNGNIWFGDRDTGAWKYDGESMTNYIINDKLKSQMIWNIYEDKNKNLLFGLADGRVFQFNGESFDKLF